MVGKHQGIIYGKVQIFSETESLESIKNSLVSLLKEIGYPETDEEDPLSEENGDEEPVVVEEDEVAAMEEGIEEVEEEEVVKPQTMQPWAKKR
jgi:hypothetical protein